MTEQNSLSSIDDIESSLKIPAHPFFDGDKQQASFIDCIDAINHVRGLVDLCNSLELENGVGIGLTSRADVGYLWVSLLSSQTLGFSSDRLMEWYHAQRKHSDQAQAQLSALLQSLPTLGKANRERYLNSVAAQLDINRSELEQLIENHTTQ